MYRNASASSRLTADAQGNDSTEGGNGHGTGIDSEAPYNLANTQNGERGKRTVIQLEAVVGIGLESCRAAGGRDTARFT